MTTTPSTRDDAPEPVGDQWLVAPEDAAIVHALMPELAPTVAAIIPHLAVTAAARAIVDARSLHGGADEEPWSHRFIAENALIAALPFLSPPTPGPVPAVITDAMVEAGQEALIDAELKVGGIPEMLGYELMTRAVLDAALEAAPPPPAAAHGTADAWERKRGEFVPYSDDDDPPAERDGELDGFAAWFDAGPEYRHLTMAEAVAQFRASRAEGVDG